MIESLESRRLLAAVVPGDATGDGKVNIDDYGIIDTYAGESGVAGPSQGDFNSDGKVNIDDYGIIDRHAGATSAVHRLVLINAATNQEIGELTDGMTIDISKTPNLNIRAEAVGYQVGSVRFDYDGSTFRTETSAPYAFAGDIGGSTYQSWTPTTGTHDIEARAFSEAGGTGIPGGATAAQFTVIQSDPTPEPDPTPDPDSGAFPDATTTGPSNRALLVERGSFSVNEDGAVIENFIVRNGGQIIIAANNVTLRNFVVENPQTTGAAIKFASNDLTGGVIEDGEIFGGLATNGVSGSNYTARRLHIHHMISDAFRVKSNVTIEDSYLHNFSLGDGAHGDGVQMYPTDGGNMRIVGNHIDARGGNAALFQVNGGWHVEGNFFQGGNYTIQAGGEVGNVFLNNTFARNSKYGPIRVGSGDESLLTWSGNVWEDNGEPVLL